MATHDYVIANGTGAAVRSDLNGALAAIVSQNSSATEPSPSYAYQRWADTTAGVMKMRNGANNAWITLYQLDGEWSTIAFENGTAAAPSIYFKDSGTDTGFYSPGADQVGISTGGTARITVDGSGNVNIDSNTLYVDAANNRVGIGTSSPGALLNLQGTFGTSLTTGLRIDGLGTTTNYVSPIAFYIQSSNWGTQHAANIACGTLSGTDGGGYLRFSTSPDGNTAPTEKLRITAAGLVGIGTTSPSNLLHLSTAGASYLQIQNTTAANSIYLGNSSGNGVIQVDGANSLNISTNGSERARIDSSGRLLVGTSSARSSGLGSGISLLVEGAPTTINIGTVRNSNDAGSAKFVLAKTRGSAVGSNTVVQSGDSFGTLEFDGADGTQLVCGATIEAFVDGTPGTNDMPGRLVFSTTADGSASPTERMRITSGGDLLVGTTTAGGKLAVASASATISPIATTSVTGDTVYQAILVTKFDNNTTTSQNFIQFQVNNGGANCGRITANGANTAAFGSTSDVRLKENVENLPPQLQNILSLRPVEFDYIESEGGGHQIGFIAQEMQAIYPDVVNQRGEDDMLMITGWSKTEARLVKALQEAVAKIETFEARLSALEGA